MDLTVQILGKWDQSADTAETVAKEGRLKKDGIISGNEFSIGLNPYL